MTDRAPEHDAWAWVLDPLIVGVSHSISNRVAALAGISDLLVLNEPASPPITALADEVPKFEEALRLLRLLALPVESDEGVDPIGVIRDAIAVAKLHPELKGVSYTLDGEGGTPVWGRPVSLTHRVAVILIRAAEAIESGEIHVRLEVEGDELVVTAGGYSLRVPTLIGARTGGR